jgi:hypothetical protein
MKLFLIIINFLFYFDFTQALAPGQLQGLLIGYGQVSQLLKLLISDACSPPELGIFWEAIKDTYIPY